jgi:hypothetical protein
MKKIITLILLFTLVGFLSANQVIITNDYQYIVSTGKTYNFNNGNPSNNVKYDRTNKIQIQNNKVLADPLKYHYAFFWDEVDSFIGYYKTNKGITTSGEYLGQVNTQSIPLPLNAYSFALVRYDNDSNQTFTNFNGGTSLGTFVQSFTTASTTHFIKIDFLNDSPATSTITNIQFEQNTASTTFEAFIEPTISLNLTSLFGAGNEPNKPTMDGYYQDYEDWQDYSFILPLTFNTQTISFETIYFDDGVSTEIERLGSILIFTLIGFTLMIFGFASKRRIFNLLAVGAFVVLGFLLIEFVGFIIILFGLIFVNVYYTFFGEL